MVLTQLQGNLMDITYQCMDAWQWLVFMFKLDALEYTGHAPFIIVEFADYVHAYIFHEDIQEVCHIQGYEK